MQPRELSILKLKSKKSSFYLQSNRQFRSTNSYLQDHRAPQYNFAGSLQRAFAGSSCMDNVLQEGRAIFCRYGYKQRIHTSSKLTCTIITAYRCGVAVKTKVLTTPD